MNPTLCGALFALLLAARGAVALVGRASSGLVAAPVRVKSGSPLRAEDEDATPPPAQAPPPPAATETTEKTQKPPAVRPGQYDVSKLVSKTGPGFNQFDPVLSATGALSRRFGIVGGLAIFGALAVIEGREIVASFLDGGGPEAGSGEVVTTPSGLKYKDVLVGKGGQTPLPGYVIGLRAKVSIGDSVIYDTKDEKPIAFKYGSRPFQNVLCEGVEEGIRGMRVGGKRTLVVPANLAPPGVDLPPGVPLVYEVELTEVLSGYF